MGNYLFTGAILMPFIYFVFQFTYNNIMPSAVFVGYTVLKILVKKNDLKE